VIPVIAAKTALGRVGEPDDIGMVIAALVSGEGRRITAQNIDVSGGYNPLARASPTLGGPPATAGPGRQSAQRHAPDRAGALRPRLALL
jgi:hypothetical protein